MAHPLWPWRLNWVLGSRKLSFYFWQCDFGQFISAPFSTDTLSTDGGWGCSEILATGLSTPMQNPHVDNLHLCRLNCASELCLLQGFALVELRLWLKSHVNKTFLTFVALFETYSYSYSNHFSHISLQKPSRLYNRPLISLELELAGNVLIGTKFGNFKIWR